MKEFQAPVYVIVFCGISTVLIVLLNMWSVLLSSNGVVIGLVVFPGVLCYMCFAYKLYTIELNHVEEYGKIKSYLTFN